jgi:hypothetical protein
MLVQVCVAPALLIVLFAAAFQRPDRMFGGLLDFIRAVVQGLMSFLPSRR